MVTSANMIEFVLQRDPAFGAAWAEHLRSWDGCERGPYNDIDAYLKYVCQLVRTDLPGAGHSFQIVEELLGQGDHEVQTVVALGFLESLTNLASNGKVDPVLFVSLLGPLSAEECRALDVFWGTRLPGLWPDTP